MTSPLQEVRVTCAQRIIAAARNSWAEQGFIVGEAIVLARSTPWGMVGLKAPVVAADADFELEVAIGHAPFKADPEKVVQSVTMIALKHPYRIEGCVVSQTVCQAEDAQMQEALEVLLSLPDSDWLDSPVSRTLSVITETLAR